MLLHDTLPSQGNSVLNGNVFACNVGELDSIAGLGRPPGEPGTLMLSSNIFITKIYHISTGTILKTLSFSETLNFVTTLFLFNRAKLPIHKDKTNYKF